MSEWLSMKIGELGKVVTGKTPSKNTPEQWGDDLIFVTPSDFKVDEKYITNTARKISQQGFEQFKNIILPSNSIMVSCIGSDMGKVTINQKVGITNQQINSIIIDKNRFDIDFIYYSLKFNYKILKKFADGGSTMPILNKSTFENLKLDLPKEKNDQTKYSSPLKLIDSKISLLRQQNETLEELAQTLFKHWFVDFEFPDENGQPYKSSGGKMIDSELGEIPEGWRNGVLNELIIESIGGDYGKEISIDDYKVEVTCLRGTDLPDMKTGIPTRAPVRFLKVSKLDKCRLKPGDLVIEISGGTEGQSTGRVIYINQEILEHFNRPMTCVNFCRILRPKKVEFTYFTYLLIDFLYKKGVFFNLENGSTGIKNLDIKTLLNDFQLNLPTNKLVEKYHDLNKNLFKKIQDSNKEIHSLIKLRDTLLPKLMNGELTLNRN